MSGSSTGKAAVLCSLGLEPRLAPLGIHEKCDAQLMALAISGSLVTETAALASVVLLKPKKRPNSSWKKNKWARRLNTVEDAFSIHKINGAANLASSLIILGTGANNGWTCLPDSLEVWQLLFQYTTIVIGLSAVRMAMIFRANDPCVRDVMISMAFASMAFALGGTWISPFHQDWMSTPAGQAGLIFLNGGATILAAWSAQKEGFVSDLVIGRMGKEYENSLGHQRVVEAVCLLAVLVPVVMGIYGTWFFTSFSAEDYIRWMDDHSSLGGNHGAAVITYLLDASCLAMLYSNFLTTLRDRKLIPAAVETTGAVLSLAVVMFAGSVFAAMGMLPNPI